MSGRKGEAAVDWWTLVHFAGGLLLGLLPMGWLLAVALIIGYEAIEGALRRIKVEEGGLFEYESWPNIALDIAIGLAGFAITHLTLMPYLGWDWSVPF